MHFRETIEGAFRIYAGALEAPQGDGYTAALVVRPVTPAQGGRPHDALRDDSLACGYRWPTAEEALTYALRKGRQFARSQPDRQPA